MCLSNRTGAYDRGAETEPARVDDKLNVDEVGFEIIGKC
jgi:hypothetical protein